MSTEDIVNTLRQAIEDGKSNPWYIYSLNPEIFEDHFCKTGEFAQFVNYNRKTRSMLKKISYDLLSMAPKLYPFNRKPSRSCRRDKNRVSVGDEDLFAADLADYLKNVELFKLLEWYLFKRLTDENIMIVKKRVMRKCSYDIHAAYVRALLQGVYLGDGRLYLLKGFESYIPSVTREFLETHNYPSVLLYSLEQEEVSKHFHKYGADKQYLAECVIELEDFIDRQLD